MNEPAGQPSALQIVIGFIVGAFILAAIVGGAAFCTLMDGAGGTSDKPHLTTMNSDIFGCQDRPFIDRFNRILGEGDKETAMRLIRAGLADGECAEFSKGDVVHIEHVAIGLYQVRPQGSVAAYWVPAVTVNP